MVTKAYKSSIPGIKEHMFNTGQNKFVAQFTQSRENVANFLQQTANEEGYLVAETVRTGKQQMIDLPPPIDGNDPNTDDLKIVHAEEVITRKISFNDMPGNVVKDVLVAVARNKKEGRNEVISDLNVMRVSELRRMLNEKGLNVDGSRETMIEALKSSAEDS